MYPGLNQVKIGFAKQIQLHKQKMLRLSSATTWITGESHLKDKDVGPSSSRQKLQFNWTFDFSWVVPLHVLASDLAGTFDAQEISLSVFFNRQSFGHDVWRQLRHEDVAVLVDLHRCRHRAKLIWDLWSVRLFQNGCSLFIWLRILQGKWSSLAFEWSTKNWIISMKLTILGFCASNFQNMLCHTSKEPCETTGLDVQLLHLRSLLLSHSWASNHESVAPWKRQVWTTETDWNRLKA